MDKKDLERVIVGNVVLHGRVLRRYLKKSSYWLTYKPDIETIRLSANHGGGGELLLEIRNASHESAAKLAEELGFVDNSGPCECLWSKCNPVLTLYHDGSAEAESFRMEILKLGLPFTLFKNAEEWGVVTGMGGKLTSGAGWTPEKVFDEIRDVAKRWEKQLNTQP